MDGILIVNKPKGYTSHDVVAKIKKIVKVKVGHTGTLDPMATGVLPLLLGDGTKLSKYLIDHDKIYEATIKLGKRTNTGDSEGNIIEEKEVDENILTNDYVRKVLNVFLGKQIQIPPIYSAIKVNGKKLYEYARKNETVEVPKREIEIYEINLLGVNTVENTISFKVHCSKGTYIRSLCEDIAKKLNTVGYMKELNRIKVGQFSLEQAIKIDEIESNLKENLITIEQFFNNKPKIMLNDYKLNLFLNGVQLTVNEPDGIYSVQNFKKEFIGSGIIKNELLKRDIVVRELK